MSILDAIFKYDDMTAAQAIEPLKQDWQDPLFRKVALATFGKAKYFLSATKFMGFVRRETSKPKTPLSVDHALWGVLEALASGDLSGNRAKEELWVACSDLNSGDLMVVMKILDKSWRNGVTTDLINKAVPGTFREVDLMRASPYLKRLEMDAKKPGKFIQWPMLATTKYDGYRAVWSPVLQQALSRDGNPFPLRDGLKDLFHRLSSYLQTAYDLPSLPAVDVELFKGSWKATAEARATGYDEAKVIGFLENDDLIYGGESKPYQVSQFFDRVMNFALGSNASQSLQVPNHAIVCTPAEAQTFFEEQIAAGNEGTILRPLIHPYKSGRGTIWLKHKAEETEDLVIVGTVPADPLSKHAGLVGAVLVNKNGVVSGVAGMSDKLRYQVTEMGDSIVGVLGEVSYQELTPDGHLRHGSLKRLRFDKSLTS